VCWVFLQKGRQTNKRLGKTIAKRASNKHKATENHCKKGVKQTQGYGKPLQKGHQTNKRLGKTIAKRASNKQKARENHCKKTCVCLTPFLQWISSICFQKAEKKVGKY